MGSYVADKSQYIYWATPQCRKDIRVGDKAFIWRALGEGPRGIISASYRGSTHVVSFFLIGFASGDVDRESGVSAVRISRAVL
jgi:hypothetical protein